VGYVGQDLIKRYHQRHRTTLLMLAVYCYRDPIVCSLMRAGADPVVALCPMCPLRLPTEVSVDTQRSAVCRVSFLTPVDPLYLDDIADHGR
jgi:hypothetical protein